jgi:hypothetical protein
VRLLFLLFGPAIHRYIAKGYIRPKGFDGMSVAFSGLDGRSYWTWQDLGEMPPVRQKHIERCLKFADAGIGEKALNELCDLAEAANMDAMKATKADLKSKAHSKVAYLIGEIRNRPRNVIPEEVYMDMAAVFAVREDEDPRKFDPAIHGQKIEMLTKAMKDGHDFFGVLPALKTLLGSLLTTEAACIELLSEWAAQRARMAAIRATFGKSSTGK